MVDVIGIDWATTPSRRFAVRLRMREEADGVEVVAVDDKLDDQRVHDICADTSLDSVGIDVAFGWPREFCEFVADWRPGQGDALSAVEPNRFMFRHTDRVVSEMGLGRPLSVSTNLLGRSAQSWTHQFLAASGPSRDQIDVFGDERGPSDQLPRLVEVYPKATLNALQSHEESSKRLDLEGFDRRDSDSRRALLEGLERAVGLTGIEPASFASNEHRVDALLAALATGIYASACRRDLGLLDGWSVHRPAEDEREHAKREGWIFVPVR